jgi:diaminohydroxyphosphoribosylaminopyrimidine deaminase/5-amino-6-(5-phosphoribosylamino)uracil reductase
MVGCVLVKDGQVVSEGWHAEYGGPHAEVAALGAAGSGAAGATAYVSLEPCDHQGKTPPCSRALIEAGIGRVVFGAADPGPNSSGGADTLRAAGIETEGPNFDDGRARRENPVFFHGVESDTPYVALKLAASHDGKIAARVGERTAVTGPQAVADVHRLRAGFDAILVGSETVLVDDPLLTVRGDAPPRVAPLRVVLDGRGRVSTDAALFRDVDVTPLLMVTSQGTDDAVRSAWERAGATVRTVGVDGGRMAVEAVLQVLSGMGVRSLLCEGGAEVAASLLRADRVERFYLYRAEGVLGVGGPGLLGVDEAATRAWLRASIDGRPPEGWELVEGPRPMDADVLTVWDRVR